MTDTTNRSTFAVGCMLARRILRYVLYALLVLIVIPSGAVQSAALHVFACGFLAVALLATIVAEENPTVRGAYRVALVIALAMGLWIVLQAIPIPSLPFANPIWADASRLYGPMAQSITVAPGDTLEGLIAALQPFAVFMTVLLLFRKDEDAFNLLRVIVIAGIVICMIGIVQFLFFPDMLLFAIKNHYLGSLTAVFVNRNTAATYIGMIMIFSAGLALHYVQNAGLRSLFKYLINAPSHTTSSDAMLCIAYGLASAMTLLALMLTQSRAGIASTMLGSLLLATILTYSGSLRFSRRSRQGFAAARIPIWIELGRTALILIAIVAVGLMLSGQPLLRARLQGTTDLRFCFLPSLLEMTKDNWLTGTGFATFPNVFPAYRNPLCGMDGVLMMAHNFYLEGWITLGLPFVIAAVATISALVFYLIGGIRLRRQHRWVPAAGLAVLVLQLAHNSVDFSLQNPGVAAVFAALMGATIVVSRGRTAKKSMPAPSSLQSDLQTAENNIWASISALPQQQVSNPAARQPGRSADNVRDDNSG